MNYIALLKGAPITVLFALLSEGGCASTGKLIRITGYSQPTVSRACRQLCEAGLAVSGQVGWTVLEGELQMVLGTKNILPTTTVFNIDDKQITLNLKAEEGKNILVLKQAGIGEPLRSQLASLPLDYLEAHISHWRKEKKPVNILIHRLKNGDKAPENPNDPQRYITGEFADFVEH